MSQQTQLSTITADLVAVSNDLNTISGDLTTLSESLDTDATNIENEIAALQAANPTLDLTALIAASAGLDTSRQALDAAAAAVSTAAGTVGAIAPTIPTPVQAFDPGSTPANLPLYTYAGTLPAPGAPWSAATDVTGTGGVVLYTFASDTPNGAPTGAQAGVWVPYTGTTVPVSVVTPPPTPVQQFDTTSGLALYLYDGPAPAPVGAPWVLVTDVTDPSGAGLYTNSGDVAGAAPAFVEAGVWDPYTITPAVTTPPVVAGTNIRGAVAPGDRVPVTGDPNHHTIAANPNVAQPNTPQNTVSDAERSPTLDELNPPEGSGIVPRGVTVNPSTLTAAPSAPLPGAPLSGPGEAYEPTPAEETQEPSGNSGEIYPR